MIPSSTPRPREGVRGRSAAGEEEEEEEDEDDEDAEDAAGRSGAGVPGQRLGVLLAAGLAGGRPAAAALRRGEIFLLRFGFSPSVRAGGGICTGSGGGWYPSKGMLLAPQSCPGDGRGARPTGKDPPPRCGGDSGAAEPSRIITSRAAALAVGREPRSPLPLPVVIAAPFGAWK